MRVWKLLLPLAATLASAALSEARAAVSCGTPSLFGTTACYIDSKIDSAALCNDGTQPAFWVRPGSGSGLSRWVIWLQGGGECTDRTSCAMRAQSGGSAGLITSNGFTAGNGGGVLSPIAAINPILYNANTVMVHYCSSDDWSGNYTSARAFSATDPTTWDFQGRRIAVAAIASLRELPLGFANATQILLGGDSAGGLGITVTVNDILPVLPPAQDVRFVSDAGFTLDIGQYDPNAAAPYIYPDMPNAFHNFFRSAIALWHGRGDAKCDADAQTERQHIQCYNSSIVMHKGYIDLPSFVAESQLDTMQVSRELCPREYGKCRLPHDPGSTQAEYATAFGTEMAKKLMGAGTAAAYSVYAPNLYLHLLLADTNVFIRSFSFPGARLSPRTVFDAWLRNPYGNRIVALGNGAGVSASAAQVPR